MLKRVMSRFSVVFFVSQNQKTLQVNPSLVCFRKLPVAKKLIDKRGEGSIKILRRHFLVSVTKEAVGEPFSLSSISGIEKVWMRGWGGGSECQIFRSKTSCRTVPEKLVGQTSTVSLLSGLEKFHASEGYVTFFCRNFLSDTAEKLRRGTLLCCVSESFW